MTVNSYLQCLLLHISTFTWCKYEYMTALNNLHEKEKSPFLMYFYYRNKTMPYKEQHNYFDNRISYSIFNINVL